MDRSVLSTRFALLTATLTLPVCGRAINGWACARLYRVESRELFLEKPNCLFLTMLPPRTKLPARHHPSSCVPIKRTASFRRPPFAYRLSFPLPPDMPPPNSDDSDELGVAAGGAAGAGAAAGAAIIGRATGFGFAGFGAAGFGAAGFGAAAFLLAFFLGAALLATFFAVFFLAAFLFGAALRRADFFAALRATFLRVIFDLDLTRAFFDFAAFFFPRFFDAFFAAIVSPLPLDRCVFERVRFPDRAN